MDEKLLNELDVVDEMIHLASGKIIEGEFGMDSYPHVYYKGFMYHIDLLELPKLWRIMNEG